MSLFARSESVGRKCLLLSAARPLAVAMVATLLYIDPGWAQQAPASADYQMEDIVVTAQRRAQNLQEVAASVTAFGGEELAEAHVTNAAALAETVPGLEVSTPTGEGGGPIFALRGISASDFSFNQSRPIALYLDEGIRGLGGLEVLPFFDIERVEVLKGPQGTLYGKNASGGAINIITRRPGFETEGYVTAGYGNYDRRSIEGAVQTPLINDVLAVRAAFQGIKGDGVFKNAFPGGEDGGSTDILSGRLSLLYKPSSSFQALLRVHRMSTGGTTPLYYAANIDSAFLGVDRSGLDFFETSANRSFDQQIESTGVNLALTFNLGKQYTLTSISTYDHADWDSGGDFDSLPIQVDHSDLSARNIEQFMQEFRIQSDYDGPFNWLGGLFYSHDTVDIITDYRFLNEPSLGVIFDPNVFGVPYAGPTLFGLNEHNEFTQKRDSYAAYLRAEYALTPTVTVSAGIRGSKDKVKVLNYNAILGGQPAGGDVNGADIVFLVPTIVDVDKRGSFDNVSTEAGVEFKPNDDMLLYATFRQGYRSGAVNAQAFFSPSEVNVVRPETVNGYEAGFKTEWFGWIKFNGAAFYYQYKNQQFLDLQGNQLILRNAARSRVRGVEWEIDARVARPLTLSAAGTYIDPKYRSLTLSGLDLSGNQLIGSAKWNLNFGADLTAIENSSGQLKVHGDLSYTSRIYFDAFNQPSFSAASYWVTNGRLSWSANEDRWSIGIWGRNLLNEKYLLYGFNGKSLGFGYDQMGRGQPRTYGADLTLRL